MLRLGGRWRSLRQSVAAHGSAVPVFIQACAPDPPLSGGSSASTLLGVLCPVTRIASCIGNRSQMRDVSLVAQVMELQVFDAAALQACSERAHHVVLSPPGRAAPRRSMGAVAPRMITTARLDSGTDRASEFLVSRNFATRLLEVDVIPDQREKLALAHSGLDRQFCQRRVVRTPGLSARA